MVKSYLLRLLAAVCFGSLVNVSHAGPLYCEASMVDRMRAAVATATVPRDTIFLTDEKAERFLAFLNFNFGWHTDNWAQAVIVRHYPGYGFDDVSLVNNDCVSGTIRVQSRATRVAMEAAENPFHSFP
jgi:hypothetical protein